MLLNQGWKPCISKDKDGYLTGQRSGSHFNHGMKITAEGEKEAYENPFPKPGSPAIPSSSRTSPQQDPAAKDPVTGKKKLKCGDAWYHVPSNVRSFWAAKIPCSFEARKPIMPWTPAVKAPVSEIKQTSAPQHWSGLCRSWWIWETIFWTSLDKGDDGWPHGF